MAALVANANHDKYCFLVSGLSRATQNQTFHRFFKQYPGVIQAEVILTSDGGSTGLGFVTFGNEESMQAAIPGISGQHIDERIIRFEVVKIQIGGGMVGNNGPVLNTPVYRLVYLSTPPTGCIAVSCDGSHREDRDGRGYIARDSSLKFLFAYAAMDADCIKTMRAGDAVSFNHTPIGQEIEAIHTGMIDCIKRKKMYVVIQSDCLDAITYCNERNKCPTKLQDFMNKKIWCLYKRFKMIKFEFLYREANTPADLLSKHVTTPGSRTFENFCSLPRYIKKAVSVDEEKLPFLRLLGYLRYCKIIGTVTGQSWI